VDSAFFRAWLAQAATAVEVQRDHLTQLDAAIGDADHGTNLSRGFGAIMAVLPDASTPTPGSVLLLAGSTLISKVGGASGPLYGMAFRQAGKALADSADVDALALAGGLEAALAGVQKLGAAREGDKTMVDALAPAVSAFASALSAGESESAAFEAMATAAAAGAQATVPMRALKGRASYLGPRSVGHEDPGAASTALILGALRDTALRDVARRGPARRGDPGGRLPGPAGGGIRGVVPPSQHGRE
jgi:phosphoenolpyruvate---glycerone phosphotransferase subunit DhaL